MSIRGYALGPNSGSPSSNGKLDNCDVLLNSRRVKAAGAPEIVRNRFPIQNLPFLFLGLGCSKVRMYRPIYI